VPPKRELLETQEIRAQGTLRTQEGKNTVFFERGGDGLETARKQKGSDQEAKKNLDLPWGGKEEPGT